MKEFDNIEFPSDFDDLSKYAPTLKKIQSMEEGFVLPENYFNQSAELLNANTVLSKENAFVVPENYFESLAEKIISLANISGIKDNDGFSVPEHYFEKFADDVISNAGLHSLSNKDGFEVPENYFGEFDSELNTKLALDNLKQDEGFAVPDDYFEKFTDRITAQASLEDAIEKQSVVPEGYFDTLADRIQSRIEEEQGARNKEQGRVIVFAEIIKRYSRPVAIAASAALLIAAAFWFLNRDASPSKDVIADNHTKPAVIDSVKMQMIPEHHEIAQEKQEPVKVPRKVNLPASNDVQLAKNDIMEQSDLIDVNMVADFISDNANIDLAQHQVNDPSIDADVINQVLDADDIINGMNNK